MALEPYRGHISMLVNDKEGFFDFEFDEAGRVRLIEGPLEVAQAARLRLALWQGGWVLDQTHGVPWFRYVGRKDVTPELIQMQLRAVILRDERIRRVTTLEVTPDDLGRVWFVRFEGETATGEALRSEFSLSRI